MTMVHLPDCCPRAALTAEFLGSGAAAAPLAVHGEIDSDNVDHLAHLLSAACAASPGRLVIDMAGVTFLGSAGIRALMIAQAGAEADGGQLVLRDPRPLVHRVLELSGLLEVFDLPARPSARPARRMVDVLFEPSA